MHITNILEDLKETFEGSPWYGNSLSNYLQNIKPDSLNYRQHDSHSIGQIIEHMIVWRQFTIDKILGQTTLISVNGSEDWEGRVYTPSDMNVLFGRIKDTQKRLIKILEEQTDNFLDKPVPEEQYSFRFMIRGLIYHDVYHLGQLYMLSKMAKQDNLD